MVAINPISHIRPGHRKRQAHIQPKAGFQKTDLSNDGKFSFWEATKNFFKGIFSPVTALFSSVKNFFIGAAMIAGGAALMIATAGAIAPFLVAIGVGFGVLQLGVGAYKLATAKNGDEAERAFFDFGAGTSAVALSMLGAKASLKQAGINDAYKLSYYRATIQSFKESPASLKNSYLSFKDGSAKTRLVNFITQKRPRVAIVDDYIEEHLDFHNNKSFEVTHGDAVETVLRGTHPRVKVDRYVVDKGILEGGMYDIYCDLVARGINPDKMTKTQMAFLIRARGINPLSNELNSLLRNIQGGAKYDAINLSFGNSAHHSGIAGHTWLPITPKNVSTYRQQLFNWYLRRGSPDADITLALQDLADTGTPLYIAGGNDGKHFISTYNLIDDSIGVGALESNGLKASYTADNSLLRRFELGRYNYADISGGTSEIALVIDGKKVPLPSRVYSTHDANFTPAAPPRITHKRPIGLPHYTESTNSFGPGDMWGTSLASPRAIGVDLLKSHPTFSRAGSYTKTSTPPMLSVYNSIFRIFFGGKEDPDEKQGTLKEKSTRYTQTELTSA